MNERPEVTQTWEKVVAWIGLILSFLICLGEVVIFSVTSPLTLPVAFGSVSGLIGGLTGMVVAGLYLATVEKYERGRRG